MLFTKFIKYFCPLATLLPNVLVPMAFSNSSIKKPKPLGKVGKGLLSARPAIPSGLLWYLY